MKTAPTVTIHEGRQHITIVNADDPTDRTRMTKADTARVRRLCARRRWSVEQVFRAAVQQAVGAA